jgi:hypothetical protein
MVPITSLLVPILVASVLVFVASAIVHMVLGYHNSDFAGVPDEDRLRAALGPLAIPPGEYVVPHGGGAAAMKDPAFVEKMRAGPVAMLTVIPSGPPAMGKQLGLWFVHIVVVGIFTAYVTGRALSPGAEGLQVFRFAGTVAFIAYAVADWPNSIWYRRAWSTALKNSFDGLVYALLTGAAFWWLWPG